MPAAGRVGGRHCAFLHEVSQYLVDDRLILDAGDHLGFSAALWADRHIDIEYPFQAFRPSHGLVALFGCFVFLFLSGATFAAFSRRHIYPVFAVGGKYAMEPGQIHSGFRHQCRQLGNEIRRLEHDMSSPIAVGRFEKKDIKDRKSNRLWRSIRLSEGHIKFHGTSGKSRRTAVWIPRKRSFQTNSVQDLPIITTNRWQGDAKIAQPCHVAGANRIFLSRSVPPVQCPLLGQTGRYWLLPSPSAMGRKRK